MGVYGATVYGGGTYGPGADTSAEVHAAVDLWWGGQRVYRAGDRVLEAHPGYALWAAEGKLASAAPVREVFGSARAGAIARRRSVSAAAQGPGVGGEDFGGEPVPPPSIGDLTLTSWTWSSPGSGTVAKPSGTAVGDLLVAVQLCDGAGTLAGLTAPDSTWVQRGSGVATASGGGKVWTKNAGASEPEAYTFNAPQGGTTGGGSLAVSDDFPGANGAALSSNWQAKEVRAGATAQIQDGTAQLYAGTGTGYTARISVQLVGAPASDLDISSSFQFTGGGGDVWWYARADAGGLSTTGVGLRIDRNGQWFLYDVVNYSGGTPKQSGTWAGGAGKVWARMLLSGSSVQVKVWNDGTPEPAFGTATTTQYTTGITFLQVKGAGNDCRVRVDTVRCYTVGGGGGGGGVPAVQQVLLARVQGAHATNPILAGPVWQQDGDGGTTVEAPSVAVTAQGLVLRAWSGVLSSAAVTWSGVPDLRLLPLVGVPSTLAGQAAAHVHDNAATSTGTSSATTSPALSASTGMTVVIRGEGVEQPEDPGNPDQPGPSGRLVGMWLNGWQQPPLSGWPADVIGSGNSPGLVNHVIACMGQSAQGGTGLVQWAPSNGPSVSGMASQVAAVRARGTNVIFGFGGSGDGGITITNPTQVTQAVSSLSSIVNTYGFNGIDIDLEGEPGPTWNQTSLVSLAGQMRAAFGANFIIGVTVALFGNRTAAWTGCVKAMIDAGHNPAYLGIMCYDFVEATDSRLTPVVQQKVQACLSAGIPQSKVMIGFMQAPSPGYPASTIPLIQAAWDAAESQWSGLRGAFHWDQSIDASKGWGFARTIGPRVLGV